MPVPWILWDICCTWKWNMCTVLYIYMYIHKHYINCTYTIYILWYTNMAGWKINILKMYFLSKMDERCDVPANHVSLLERTYIYKIHIHIYIYYIYIYICNIYIYIIYVSHTIGWNSNPCREKKPTKQVVDVLQWKRRKPSKFHRAQNVPQVVAEPLFWNIRVKLDHFSMDQG